MRHAALSSSPRGGKRKRSFSAQQGTAWRGVVCANINVLAARTASESCASLRGAPATKQSAPTPRSALSPTSVRSGRTGLLRFVRNDEEKREAERRKTRRPNLCARRRHVYAVGANHLPGTARARQSALACRRPATALTCGALALGRNSRPGFLGRGRVTAFAGRVLPAPSCPSPVDAPHTPAVVPASMMPGAAPARFANPRGSTALAPCSGVPREHVPQASEMKGHVTTPRTPVKGSVP